MKKLSPTAVMVACCSMASMAYTSSYAATTTSGSVDVKLVLTDSCLITGNDETHDHYGTLDFGTQYARTYNELSTSLAPTSGTALQISCSDPHDVTVQTDAGLHSLGQQRRMLNAASDGVFVPYTLYRPTDVNASWEPNTPVVIASVASTAVSLTFTAKVPAADNGNPAGNYSDTLQMTITY